MQINRKAVTAIGRKKVKMPQVEFDLRAIREIKKRKKDLCKTYSKGSKKRG